jgi:hypothetical protein
LHPLTPLASPDQPLTAHPCVQVKELYEVLSRNTGQSVTVVRTSHAVTFLFAPPYRHVQIVLRYVGLGFVLIPSR